MFALGVSEATHHTYRIRRMEPRRPSARRRCMRSLVPVVLACVGVLAGCGLLDRPATPAQSEASFQDRAAAVAQAWKEGGMSTAWGTGFVPLQELTLEPAWTPSGDLKASYGNGWIRSTSPLPDANSQGDIRFADGSSMPVPLIGARTTYSQLPRRTGDCPMAGQPPTCQWLTISAARMSTVQIDTTRGKATVPAWHFTVAGLTQPLIKVAVAPAATTRIPQVTLSEVGATNGVVSAMQLISSTGNGLAFDIGIGACDRDPRGLVREFPDLIVIGGSVLGPEAGTGCNAMMLSHRVELRTKRPVGTRPIVDALSGRPLLIQPTPPGH